MASQKNNNHNLLQNNQNNSLESQSDLEKEFDSGEFILDDEDNKNSTEITVADDPVLLNVRQKAEVQAFFLAGATLSNISLRSLSEPEQLQRAITAIQTVLGGKKVTKQNLCAVLGVDTLNILNYEMGDILRVSLKKMDQKQAFDVWDKLSKSLHHMIISVDESTVDLDIIKMFDIDGGTIIRSMLTLRTLARSEQGLNTRIFSKFTEDTGEQIVQVFQTLRMFDSQNKDYGELLVTEAVNAMTPKTRFFLFLADIRRFVAEGGTLDELWTRVDCNDTVPYSMHFAFFLQKNYLELYNEIIEQTKQDKEFWEIREIIKRNMDNTEHSSQFDNESTNDATAAAYLEKLLGAD